MDFSLFGRTHRKIKLRNFDLSFCLQIGLAILKILAEANVFPPDIQHFRKLNFRDQSLTNDWFLKIQYLRKGTCVLAETFRIF